MATDMTTPTKEMDSLEPQTWPEKDLKLNADILLGRQGIALDRMQKNSQLAFAATEFAATGDSKKYAERVAGVMGDGSAQGEDDVGVSVGNTTTINQYYQAPASSTTQPPTAEPQVAKPEPTPTVTPAAVVPDAKSKIPSWVKTAAVVASIVGGNAVTIGGAAYYLKNLIQTPIPQQIDAVTEQFVPGE